MSARLPDHVFMKRLASLASSLVGELNISGSLLEGSCPSRPLKVSEEYLQTVFLAAGELVTIYEQLDQTISLLCNFRSTPSLKEKGITRLDHMILYFPLT
jgi:hypothetical protein